MEKDDYKNRLDADGPYSAGALQDGELVDKFPWVRRYGKAIDEAEGERKLGQKDN